MWLIYSCFRCLFFFFFFLSEPCRLGFSWGNLVVIVVNEQLSTQGPPFFALSRFNHLFFRCTPEMLGHIQVNGREISAPSSLFGFVDRCFPLFLTSFFVIFLILQSFSTSPGFVDSLIVFNFVACSDFSCHGTDTTHWIEDSFRFGWCQVKLRWTKIRILF
jgi:hypothetical protein